MGSGLFCFRVKSKKEPIEEEALTTLGFTAALISGGAVFVITNIALDKMIPRDSLITRPERVAEAIVTETMLTSSIVSAAESALGLAMGSRVGNISSSLVVSSSLSGCSDYDPAVLRTFLVTLITTAVHERCPLHLKVTLAALACIRFRATDEGKDYSYLPAFSFQEIAPVLSGMTMGGAIRPGIIGPMIGAGIVNALFSAGERIGYPLEQRFYSEISQSYISLKVPTLREHHEYAQKIMRLNQIKALLRSPSFPPGVPEMVTKKLGTPEHPDERALRVATVSNHLERLSRPLQWNGVRTELGRWSLPRFANRELQFTHLGGRCFPQHVCESILAYGENDCETEASILDS